MGEPTKDISTFGRRPGAVVAGKYRLIEERGCGASGTVWSAQHVTLGASVAIKILHRDARFSGEARARFEREAKLAARLGDASPHIARVIDYGLLADDSPFLVMELLHGEELGARLKREGRVSLEVAAEIIAQLCRALEVAHAAGVIHRDVKPSNVFLCRRPAERGVFVKLMDFGVAKATLEEPGEETTRAGTVVGTPGYMSPEQVLASRLDSRTDLWSVSAMVYRMVVGVTPFGAGGFGELGVRILGVEPASPSRVLASLPKELDRFMERGLAKEPRDRFQSAHDLAQALADVAASHESARHALDARNALKEAPTLDPSVVRAVIASSMPPRAHASEPSGTSSRRRRTRSPTATIVALVVAVIAAGTFVRASHAPKLSTAAAGLELQGRNDAPEASVPGSSSFASDSSFVELLTTTPSSSAFTRAAFGESRLKSKHAPTPAPRKP